MTMKKIAFTSLIAVMAAGSANAAGFYIAPKVAWSQSRIEEARTEKAWNGEAWATFEKGKHESWSGHDNKMTPKFAVGYDYDTQRFGIVGLEVEYGNVSNHFDPTHAGVDFEGNVPNDSDSRDFKYSESTLSLNAKYGYDFKYVIPFVSAGIGYSVIESENNFRSGTYWWETRDMERNVSWNIGAGIEVPVSEKVQLTLEYRYTDLGNVKYSNSMYHEKGNVNGIERHFDSDVDLDKHEVLAGIKMSF